MGNRINYHKKQKSKLINFKNLVRSPNGKAQDFDSCIYRFNPYAHCYANMNNESWQKHTDDDLYE